MVGIIDYGMGNLASVQKTVNYLGMESVISNDTNLLSNCKYLILPGVGSYKKAIQNLKSKGLFEFIKNETITNKKSFLGICLGMQLLSDSGTEDGFSDGLGLITGVVEKIPDKDFPIPHIGWNDIAINGNSMLFNGLQDYNFYFVHSYYFNVKKEDNIKATVNYGGSLTAIVAKENIVGVQFHPEKSQTSGLIFLKNFFEQYA